MDWYQSLACWEPVLVSSGRAGEVSFAQVADVRTTPFPPSLLPPPPLLPVHGAGKVGDCSSKGMDNYVAM